MREEKQKTIQQIYDEFAHTYEENRGNFDVVPVLEDFYGTLEKSTGQLLDLGCGAGEPVSKWFISKGWEATGVDFSKSMLELAQRYVPEMKCIQSDMRNVQFTDEQFDAIVAIYSLFHVPWKDHEALFSNAFQWLKREGGMLFTYATSAYTGEKVFDGYKEFLGQRLYYSHMSEGQLYATLEKVGFVIESATHRNIGGETFLWVFLKKI